MRTDRSGNFTLDGLSDRTYNVRAIDKKEGRRVPLNLRGSDLNVVDI